MALLSACLHKFTGASGRASALLHVSRGIPIQPAVFYVLATCGTRP